jgi:hypothetical protein
VSAAARRLTQRSHLMPLTWIVSLTVATGSA